MKSSVYRFKRGMTFCLLLCGIVALLAAGCGQANTSSPGASVDGQGASGTPGAENATGKIHIVAAEQFYGEVAQAVGGERVDVRSIISGPDADPHDFDPTPDTSKAVDGAQVVIYNGLGYDDWMEKLIKASSDKGKTVIRVGEDVAGKKDGDNEHVWYEPGTMPKLAAAIADKLAALDPPHADDYRNQAKQYEATLAPLNDLVARLKQPSPSPVAVSEPVFDYMLNALNFTVTNPKFAKAVEEETDPAPADLARLTDDIKNKKIRFFVRNVQTESPQVKNVAELAQANQIPIIEVTETQPAGKTYVEWMTGQLSQVEKAAGGK